MDWDMRLQRFALFCLIPLLIALPVSAQDEPAPEFLYRDENRLVLVNGYTGETTELPIEVANRDRFAWSPNGQYLLTRLYDNEGNSYCLNLYNVDTQAWLYDEPISCAVQDAIFSPDGTQLVYEFNDGANGVAWLYGIEAETSQELYRTTWGTENLSAGVYGFLWSPIHKYLTFIQYSWIMGGTLNNFFIFNIESGNYVEVNAPDTYYATYDPIWSADDRWFLITLREEYVSGLLSSNHKGDVYLVNSDTGEKYRLTYSPAAPEEDIRWTENGNIAFTEVIRQEKTFNIEEAMNVELVPPENIVEPEDVSRASFNPLAGVIVSPDPDFGAWVSNVPTQPGSDQYEFSIGYISSKSPTANFTTLIPESYKSGNILIGWRPSAYPYSIG
jgi:WD40 repeat protein